jgi:hypothetical protein
VPDDRFNDFGLAFQNLTQPWNAPSGSLAIFAAIRHASSRDESVPYLLDASATGGASENATVTGNVDVCISAINHGNAFP